MPDTAKTRCTGRKNIEYYSKCLHSHTDSRTDVGVSNSCLYHLCSFGSGRQIKQWHLQHCSFTALIVTLCQKVPYAKPQKLKDFSSILEMRILFCPNLWEVGQCPKMCLNLSCKLHGLIFRSLFFMLGDELKPHNLLGKWVWQRLCLKISPFHYCIWHSTCVCSRTYKTCAVKPQRWWKTTINVSAVVISGKWACGALCGVKPQLWRKRGSWQQCRAEQEPLTKRVKPKEVKRKEVKTMWKCWHLVCGWEIPGFGNTQTHVPVNILERWNLGLSLA